ncbi:MULTISPECIES: potassium-transporting ATPase subunit KdpC [unclassified Herbaspirillum]|uniref:potassium-transporting ATPase subunit KdpC n=1 Tax=unclassified Herbaspirillum TaxID=2624150 RepID=UPI000E2EBAC4|nr:MULTISPECIES: potassium-transporting ATPase subunit KdpC [unclassified Herbaspirillum]RFB69669.1 potassium-transporting ATPase subunit KdpC [Herbaspirillum sp. 3R-3a1]TFI07267.1 potassium-transporting ATPase subunit KdpC [Herbaspirillum sp. 3R11]TFI12042.1 potassium-transporting ATPase subunit KdpC [Herbaspirillum sp. 3R-11]TFI26337.1 potassium-transporting ATPase subunit KdpC [Herbaspirillum sp. 3C11]
MKTYLRPAVSLFILMSIILGGLYPAVITLVGQAFFPAQANGSVIVRDGVPVGSELIGQNFTEPKYFWGRLSNSGTFPYNGGASGGSNFGPLNPGLVDAAKAREEALRAADPGAGREIPLDLLTSSGSGLDPHISPAAAAYQVARVAKVRGVSVEQIRALVKVQTEAPQWGLFGEPRVNVLKLNLALDAAAGV